MHRQIGLTVVIEGEGSARAYVEVAADDPSGTVSFGPVTYPMSSKTSRMSRFLQAGERIDAEVLLLSATPWSGVHSFTVRTEFAR